MQRIALNIIPNGVCPRVYVNQYDIGRQFLIEFTEGVQLYNFPNGVTFKINGRKPDGHVFEYTQDDTWDGINHIISIQDYGTTLKAIISTSEQMTAAAGEVLVQLTYKISNAVTGTLNFIMVVQERPEASGDPSESDVPDVVRSVNGVTPDADGDVVVPGSGTAVTKNFASLEASRTMTATRNIGDFVYISSEDQLYKITATISSGGTLVPNTNATAVTVGDVLQTLNSELTSKTGELDFSNSTTIPLDGTFTPTSDGVAYMYAVSADAGRAYVYILDNVLNRILDIDDIMAPGGNSALATATPLAKNRTYTTGSMNAIYNGSIFVPYT